MKHYTVRFLPEDRRISIRAGATLLEAAFEAGVALDSVCGGAGTCGKCILILPDSTRIQACRHTVDSDLTVTVPGTAALSADRILQHGASGDVAVEPAVRKVLLQDSPRPATAVIMADAADPWTTAAVEPGDTTGRIFGVAVDVGTTTVVARLLNLTDGACLATAAIANPQIPFGDDVVSRIAHATSEAGRNRLQQAVLSGIADLIHKLCIASRTCETDIYEVVAAGNTTMTHLLLGLPVESLGQAPYHAYCLDPQQRPAAQMGLPVNPTAVLYTIANIAGFVGADTTAVALAVGMDRMEPMTLVIDIGTNGEVILGTHERMYAASCAAGPAFEGARISQGSRAVDGAIESVFAADGDIDMDVIGAAPARSICGSGLLDAVAVLLDLGILDQTGRFAEPDALSAGVPTAIRRRLMVKDGQPAFALTPAAQQPGVVLTQRDIREMQLAKAAIRTGIEMLLSKAGLAAADVEQVLLAGGFGNYIRRESALRIGLLPAVDPARIRFVGNAALGGAQMVLLNRHCRRLSADLARRIKYVEIAHEKGFQDVFADCLRF